MNVKGLKKKLLRFKSIFQTRAIVKSGVWTNLDALFDLELFSHRLEISRL
jgi:hypothetical protein